MSELSQNGRLDDPEVQALFFEKLSVTCNVTKAAEEVGISTGTLYRRRKVNTQFRLDWEAAIAEGYDRLELLMMERVLVGTTRTTTKKDDATEVHDFPHATGLALLKMHRETAERGRAMARVPSEAEVEAAKQRILARLQRLRDQIDDKGRHRTKR